MRKSKDRTYQKSKQSSPATLVGSVRDLVTNNQKTITQSSIASSYRTANSRNTAQTQNYQDDLFMLQDVIGQQSTTIFITNQQQKVIQQILEISRKGKVNQSNAFEIPIKVLDPSHFNTSRVRFWKFASDLLKASMNIYDKRVDNVSLGVNKIYGGLGRVGDNKNTQDQTMEEAQQRQQKEKIQNRNYLLKMNIQQFNKKDIGDFKLYGEQTLQLPSKLNLLRPQSQFITDPLFYKKLKMFDQSSPKSLLLNLFNISNNLQIRIFDQDNYNNQAIYKKVDNVFDKKLSQDWKNTSFIIQNAVLFEEIINFIQEQDSKKQNNNQPITQKIRIQEINQKQQYQIFNQLNDDVNFSQNNYQQSQYFQRQVYQESIQPPMSTCSSNFMKTQVSSHPFIFDSYNKGQNQQGPYSVMTPWEFDFKKKTFMKKGEKRVKKQKNISNFQQNDQFISFDQRVTENRKVILQCTQKSNYSLKKQSNKYLQPLQLHVYDDYHNRRIIQQIASPHEADEQQIYKMPKIQQENIEFSNYYEAQTRQFQIFNHSKNMIEFENHNQIDQDQKYLIENNKKANYINIRQIKSIVLKQFNDRSQLRLSQMQFEMSPQSMLITLLHLANQKSLQLISNQNQDDVILRKQYKKIKQ